MQSNYSLNSLLQTLQDWTERWEAISMLAGNPWLLLGIAAVSLVLAFIGSSVGLILGHFRLPLLIAYLGAPTAGAMTNLFVSGAGALAGSATHVYEGRVSWKGVALIGIPSALGAIIGVMIFVRVNPVWSYAVIGTMLVISGISLTSKKSDHVPTADLTPLRHAVLEIVIGLALGALAAITGLMLGSLRLPMMIRYLRMDPKEAVGTNMVVGCMTALVGWTTGLIAGDSRLEWLVLAAVVPPTILGGWLGAWLTGRISKSAVQIISGWIISFTGFVLIGQGVVGTIQNPHRATPPLVEEDYDDDWFDFDYPIPAEVPPMPDPEIPNPQMPDWGDEENEEEDWFRPY